MSLSQRRNRQHEYDAFGTDPLTTFIDSIFSGDRGTHVANRLSGWAGDIKVDVNETRDAFLISADLPGLRKEDIKVSMNRDRILTIEAERKEESSGEDSDKNMHWKERTFGHMHRSFRLSRSANPDDCQCKYDNGVLNVRIGKREPHSDTNYLTIE